MQIIKAMLKAGVMEERAVNEEGTPQGGLISPLLANAYLDIMDEWVSKQWENKRTRHQYVQDQSRYAVMRKKTTLVPGYLVRYADDFIIATDTRAHAEDWKARLQSFLQEKMKLTLSQEKTLITDIRKKYIKFLGYEFKMVRGKSRRGYIPRTIPDRERLKRRADKIAEDIKKIPGNYSREQMVGAINRINSQIRGIIQYYQCCTWVNIAMQKHSRKLQLAARRRLKQYNGKWIPANQTRNLPRVHQQYKQKIPSIKYRDIYVGFTALTFCRWERTPPKNQAETPYTDTGRQLYFERTKKKKMQARLDEMYSDRSARAISYGKWGKFNNFEFIMNRAYALNRDKLRCRVCGGWLIANTPWAHRINPYLPLDSIMMLDANEITNQVDISLKDYSDDNIESIKAAVLSHGGKTDYLNFIDDSNNVIRSTVGYETDNNASPFSLYGKVPVSFTAKASTTQYLTGGKILIGNYAYTLGPALSASKAYSAGHGFSGTVDVKDLMGTKIGSATSHLGSLSGDWSKITPYGGEFFPVVAKATPIAGKQVYMLGATSGETAGKITRTGVSVQFPPYVTLTDMCEGNYECNPGDSGAGLFDSGAKDVLTASSNAKTYGIQSAGKFNEKGEWIGPSYFTPISNVS